MTNFDPVSYLMGQKAAGGGGSGSSTLSGLTDVDISNPTNGQTLVYNATSGKWENGAGGSGGALVVHMSRLEEETGEYSAGTYILDKTWQEIADAMLTGPVLLIYENEREGRVYTVNLDNVEVESSGGYTAAFVNTSTAWWLTADTPNGYPYYIPD